MVAYERWWLMRAQSPMSQNFASIAYSNCTDLNKLFKQKVNFEKKNNVLSNEKFLSLVLLTGSISITIQHQSCIIQFMLHYSNDLETFSILEDWSLRRSGWLREVVTTWGSTVYWVTTRCKIITIQKYCKTCYFIVTGVPYHGPYWFLGIFCCCCLFGWNIKYFSRVHFYSFEIWMSEVIHVRKKNTNMYDNVEN